MAGEQAGVRRLLPQSSQMQSFSFVPNNFGSREPQKNYVFVDEHNRHKRLKVMRACEGCRRRKIKCDAATTNTWPCSACQRLKLHCIPPTVNYDGGNSHSFEPEKQEHESGGSGDDDFNSQLPLQQQLQATQKNGQQNYGQLPYNNHICHYQPINYAPIPQGQQGMQFAPINASTIMHNQYPPSSSFTMSSMQHPLQPPTSPEDYRDPMQQQLQPPTSSDDYRQEHYGPADLADYLGDLKMDLTATAPYLNRKKSFAVEEPVFEEPDAYAITLPPMASGDMKLRIPPELMPDEETARQYFDVFFTNAHPYVPVLNKSQFYQQWQNNRESISPLILEAIFAIAGRLLDEPSQGHQWLALASRHADAFMDVPRLSTLQAMLLVLKAREAAPKRGYYYRSWMTVVQAIAMARDLGLHEHHDDHKYNKPCSSSLQECRLKSRIWQVMFVVELMVGSPQGRTDLSIDPNTVDFAMPRDMPGDEGGTTRNFTVFARCIAQSRRLSDVYSRVKKRGRDWGNDPELVQLNPSFDAWIEELSADMQVSFPLDGSPPWLPSHFIGNLHTHHYLGIIILHRPQLARLQPNDIDGKWKHHMSICYTNAKMLCRLQEGILNSFGIIGFLSMQRGINYAIYCILTCTVIHLVALTSPDLDLSKDAREYFTRHMRLLEKCTSSWPMPDVQQQIDALRDAFSADPSKPFELKPSFPYGSPAPIHSSPPSRLHGYGQHSVNRTASIDHQSMGPPGQQQMGYGNQPTPPLSSSSLGASKGDSEGIQSLVMMAAGQSIPRQEQPVANTLPMIDPSTWNPSRIFDQWNTSFGAAAVAPPPSLQPTMHRGTNAGQEVNSLPDMQSASLLPLPMGQNNLATTAYAPPVPSFVSPSMWQESVASVYEGGLKRQWEYDNSSNMVTQAMKRR